MRPINPGIALAFCAGGALTLATAIAVADPEASLTIPGRAYEPAQLDPAGVCPSPAELEMLRRRLVRDFDPQGAIAAPRGGGTMDIGEIAVLEDDGTLVDTFSNTTNTNAILNAFLAGRSDEWDYVIIYTSSDYPGNIQPEAGFAFFSPFANYAAGINRFQGTFIEESGFTRLLGVINMNDLPEYPADPTFDFFGGFGNAVEILGHETHHAFGSFIDPPLGIGATMKRDGAHWNFFLHHNDAGNASPMYGGRWQDNGDGSFTALESFNGFSKVDEYLQGLRFASEVSPFFTIGSSPTEPPERVPLPGFVALGDRVNITVGDIIFAHGPRFPTPDTSQKTFRGAFVLVVPPGQSASAADLAKLNLIRTTFEEEYFPEATNFRGVFDTRLGIDAGVNPASTPIEDDFEGELFDSGIWEYVQGVTIDGSPLNTPSGTGALRFNGDWGQGDEARSITVDLSDQAPGDVTLEYAAQRTGGGSSPNSDERLRVEYYNASGQWVLLREFLGSGPDQNVFTPFAELIPADGLHDRFRFRFRRTQGRLGPFGDYFIDDLQLVTSVGAPCPGDLSGSGSVGSEDLAILLGGWGEPGPADLSGSGTVGSEDLAILLGLWGPCP